VSDEVGRAPRLIITLVVVAIALTVGAIVTGFVIAARVGAQSTSPQTGPLAVPAAPAPGESGRYCAQVLPVVPAFGAGVGAPGLIAGTPGQAAWGDPAIILRCGLSDPAELTCSAPQTKFTAADGTAVEWLRTASATSVTYLAVDRPVRVAVTVPDSAGIGPVQQLSELIGKTLPERDVCAANGVIPADNS
jgi:hypothetical protein